MAQSKTVLVTLQGVEHLEQSELGRGAYGKVYKVKYGGAILAAKKIHRILIDDDVSSQEKQSVVDSFISECEHCSLLNHPNIVKFLGICNPPSKTKSSNVPVMVMELLDESLTAYVERKRPEDVNFSVKVSILLDVARGLSYLHAQDPAVVHRDLSPNNILLKGSKMVNEYIVAKIADLGVARAIKADSKKTQKKLTKAPGTVDFMPPEATEENTIYDVSLDVFSFGGIVLFLATHKWPTPTKLIETNPDTETIKAYSEVERRRTYLDKMTGDMEVLKSLAISCLSNHRSNRPTTVEIWSQLKSLHTSKVCNRACMPIHHFFRWLHSDEICLCSQITSLEFILIYIYYLSILTGSYQLQ